MMQRGSAGRRSPGPAPLEGEADVGPGLLPARGLSSGSQLAGRRSGTRRLVAGVAALVAVAGASWWAGSHVESTARAAALAAPPPPALLTARVAYRVLTDQVVAQGSIVPSAEMSIGTDATTVPGAQPIVTALPVPAGTQVRGGQVVMEVAGRPLFVLSGAIPMYRDLRLGDSGPDVRELQRALRSLGYELQATGTVDQATVSAAAQLYKHHGYQIPEIPTKSQQGPPSSAPSVAQTTTGQGGKPSSAASGATTQLVQLIPRSEIAFVPKLPATVSAVSVAVGARATPDALSLSIGQPVVDVPVSQAGVDKVVVGDKAIVSLPTGAAAGKVIALSTIASAASSSTGQATGSGSAQPSAVVAFDATVPQADEGSAVQVTTILRQSDQPVMAVPVAALFAEADGQDYVTTVAGGRRTDVRVRTGLSASGMVAVKPLDGALRAGQKVVVGIRPAGG